MKNLSSMLICCSNVISYVHLYMQLVLICFQSLIIIIDVVNCFHYTQCTIINI